MNFKKNNLQKEINWILDEKYEGEMTKEAKKDIEKLKQGEPIDYLIGFIDFLNCKIDLSLRPLIPRQETEFWVGESIKKIEENKKMDFLDIFSGSGCIGISLLKKFKKIKVDFAELNEESIKQIKINLKINKIDPKRYKIIKSDVFENISEKYDYIFSNPPYVSWNKKEKVQESVYKFEPHEALFAEKNGLFFIKKFLKESKNYLKKKSKIYMEFDSSQKKEIEKLLEKLNYRNYDFHKDQYKRYRYLIVNH